MVFFEAFRHIILGGDMSEQKEIPYAKEETITKFNQLAVFCLENIMPQNVPVKVFTKALQAAVIISPDWMIQTGGPFFYRYRQQITDSNVEFFYAFDYERQGKDIAKLLKGSGVSLVKLVIETIRENAMQYYKSNPENTMKIVTKLLSLYCQYALSDRAELK